MSDSFTFNIPYLIWAIICVVIVAIILIFCFVQVRRYLKKSRRRRNTDELVLDDTPVVPATVLVNCVSDAGTREQHAAAMAELRRQYVEERAATVPAARSAAPEQRAWYASGPTPQAEGRAAENSEMVPPVEVTVRAQVFQEEPEEADGTEDGSESVELFTRQIAAPRPQRSLFQETREGEGGSFLNPYASASPPTQQHQQQQEDDAPQPEGLHSSAAYQGNSGTAGPAAAHFSITLLVAANPTPLGIAHSNTLSPMYLRRNRQDGQLMLVPVVAPSGRRRELQQQQEQQSRTSPSSEAPRPYPGVMAAAATAVGRLSFLHDAHAWLRGRGRSRGSTADAATSPPLAGQRRVSRGGGRNSEDALAAEGYCCDEHGHKLTVRQAEDVYGTAAYIPQGGHSFNVLADAAEERTDARDEEGEEVESSVFSLNPLARYRGGGY